MVLQSPLRLSQFVRLYIIVVHLEQFHAVLREKLKITLRIRTIELCISFKTLAIIPSRPAALWALRLDNKASILLVVISISDITG